MSAILDLPEEIVREVFECAALSDPPRRREPDLEYAEDRLLVKKSLQYKYTLGWIHLTHVHRSLRIVGIDMAHLWASVVTVIPSPEAVDEFLCRARQSDLTLHVYADQIKYPFHLQKADVDTLAWAKLHQHRVRTIRCHAPHHINTPNAKLAEWFMITDMPYLQHLELAPDPPYLIRRYRWELLGTFDLNAPRLQSANYWNGLHSDRLPLHNLRVLKATFPAFLSNFYVHHVVGALRVAPNLEDISLRIECSIPTTVWNHLPSSSVPSLPLNRLKVYDVFTMEGDQFAYGLWETICAPNIRRVLIHCKHSNLAQRLSEHSLQPLLSRAHYTHLSLDPHRLLLSKPNADGASSAEVDLLQLSGMDMDEKPYAELIDALRTHAATSLARVRNVKLVLPARASSSDDYINASGGDTPERLALIKAINELKRMLNTATDIEQCVATHC